MKDITLCVWMSYSTTLFCLLSVVYCVMLRGTLLPSPFTFTLTLALCLCGVHQLIDTPSAGRRKPKPQRRLIFYSVEFEFLHNWLKHEVSGCRSNVLYVSVLSVQLGDVQKVRQQTREINQREFLQCLSKCVQCSSLFCITLTLCTRPANVR